MKKLILLCLMICLIILSGCCKSTEKADDYTSGKSMFVVVEEGYNWKIVYHRDTRVMYAVSSSSYNYGNFTLMVNPNGTPMLYEEDER